MMRIVTLAVAFALMVQPADLRSRVTAAVEQQQKAIVAELLELLAIPNVAADKANIRRNAEHLQRLLTRHHFNAEILETAGNPLVFAEIADRPNPALPTVLF